MTCPAIGTQSFVAPSTLIKSGEDAMRQIELRAPTGKRIGLSKKRDAVLSTAASRDRRGSTGGTSGPGPVTTAGKIQTCIPVVSPERPLQGIRFSAVFQRCTTGGTPDRWRIASSGVHGHPAAAPFTRHILDVLIGVELVVKEDHGSSNPGMGVASWGFTCTFLDRGFSATTGNYVGGEKGAWVKGNKAVVFIAMKLGVKVPTPLRYTLGVEGMSEEALTEQVKAACSQRGGLLMAERAPKNPFLPPDCQDEPFSDPFNDGSIERYAKLHLTEFEVDGLGGAAAEQRATCGCADDGRTEFVFDVSTMKLREKQVCKVCGATRPPERTQASAKAATDKPRR
jgi:hypothetical protein